MIIVFFFSTCTATSMKNPKTKVNLEIIELDPANYHVFIHAKAGRNKIRLLVDTGASKTVVNLGLISKLPGKWSEIPETESIGLSSQKVNANTFILKSLSFGEIKLSQVEAAALDLSHVNEAYGYIRAEPIHGILGSDILMQLRAVINFGKAELILHPPQKKKTGKLLNAR